MPFSTLSGKQDAAHSSIGFFTQRPVRTLNFQPCQGHRTRSPCNVPSPKGPPAWGQVLSRANSSPSTLKRATPRSVSSNSTDMQDPGGRSDNFAASIYFNKLSLTLLPLSKFLKNAESNKDVICLQEAYFDGLLIQCLA